MFTLSICPNFKGTTNQFAKALLICLCLDSIVILSVANYFI